MLSVYRHRDHQSNIEDQSADNSDDHRALDNHKLGLNDHQSMMTDQKLLLNDQRTVSTDQQIVSNDQQLVSNNQQQVLNDHTSIVDGHQPPMDHLQTRFPSTNTTSTDHSDQHLDNRQLYSNGGSDDTMQVDMEPQDLTLHSKRQSLESGTDDGACCPICSAVMFDQRMLLDHMKEAHDFGKTGPFVATYNEKRRLEPLEVGATSSSSDQPSNDAAETGICGENGSISSEENGHRLDMQHGRPKGNTYCELCDQEFCNDWFLKTHMSKVHGPDYVEDLASSPAHPPMQVLEDPSEQLPKPPTSSPAVDLGNSISNFGYSSMLDQANVMSQLSAQLTVCPFCQQYFPNMILLQSHLLTVHAGLMMNPATAMYAAGLMPMNTFGTVTGNATFQSPQINGKNHSFNGDQQQQMAAIAAAILGFGGSTGNAVNAPGTSMDYFAQGSYQTPSLIGQGPVYGPQPGTVTGMKNQRTSQQIQESSMSDSDGVKPSPLIPQTPTKNQDAYCDICQKEFCNKYFLRTHKLNKHGILEDSPKSSHNGHGNSSGRIGRPTSQSPSQEELKSIINDVIGAGKNSSVNDDGPTPSKMPKIGDRHLEAHSTPVSTVSGGQFQCNLCVKAFPSMFALVAHKYRDHGTFDGSISSATSGLSSNAPSGMQRTPSCSSAPLAPTTSHQRKSIDADHLTSPMRKMAPAQSVDLEAYCEICQKEFCSKYFLKVHRANIHGIGSPGGTTSVSGGHQSQGGNRHRSSLNGSASNGNSPGTVNVPGLVKTEENGGGRRSSSTNSGSVAALIAAATATGRPFVASKNFCDICNKELCNKYFLRTHMLKMHGIVIDENKTVIANINTLDKEKNGELLFRCDLCGEQLASRQQLRAHKQSVHQITIPPTAVHAPATNLMPENGYVNSAATSQYDQNSIKIEAAEDLSKSGQAAVKQGITTENQFIKLSPSNGSQLLKSNHSTANYSSGISSTNSVRSLDYKEVLCTICGERFKNARFLRVHILNDHTDTVVPQKMKLDSMPTCEYCSKKFPDHAELQLHVINDHQREVRGSVASMAEQAALDSVSAAFMDAVNSVANAVAEAAAGGGVENPTPSPIVDQEPTSRVPDHGDLPLVARAKNGTKLFRCSYCSYYTRWISNLSTHEKRHNIVKPADGENEEKPFKCRMCLRSYRYSHSLQRHMEVHRSATIGLRAAGIRCSPPALTTGQHLSTCLSSEHDNTAPTTPSSTAGPDCIDGLVDPQSMKTTLMEPKIDGGKDLWTDAQLQEASESASGNASASTNAPASAITPVPGNNGSSPGKRHQCHLCGKEFGHGELYRMHVLTIHNIVLPGDSSINDIPTKGTFRCRQCPFTAGRFYDLRMHTLQKHNGVSPQKRRVFSKPVIDGANPDGNEADLTGSGPGINGNGECAPNEQVKKTTKINGYRGTQKSTEVQAFWMREISETGFFPSPTVVYLPVLHHVNKEIEATFVFTPMNDQDDHAQVNDQPQVHENGKE